MPPKASRKTVEKEKKKIIEDKTFGLKNKNRSAKVQKFVQNVVQNVKCSSVAEKKRMAELQAKKDEKLEKRALEEQMNQLFNVVKGGRPAEEGDDSSAGEEGEEGDSDYGCAPEEYLWRPEDFEAVETGGIRLEDELEAERQKLQGRTDLTPVTEESFQAWKAKKRAEADDAERARITKAKASGTGLRGWDLWQHDQALFVDDADAEELYERDEDLAPLDEDEEHADPMNM